MRGTCSACWFRFRLRKDGAVGAHRLYTGGGPNGWVSCPGAGKPPREEKT